MILEIKEDNTFSVLPSLLPLGAMFLFNQVAVKPSPPSKIISVIIYDYSLTCGQQSDR